MGGFSFFLALNEARVRARLLVTTQLWDEAGKRPLTGKGDFEITPCGGSASFQRRQAEVEDRPRR
jgi:hypothetical protein